MHSYKIIYNKLIDIFLIIFVFSLPFVDTKYRIISSIPNYDILFIILFVFTVFYFIKNKVYFNKTIFFKLLLVVIVILIYGGIISLFQINYINIERFLKLVFGLSIYFIINLLCNENEKRIYLLVKMIIIGLLIQDLMFLLEIINNGFVNINSYSGTFSGTFHNRNYFTGFQASASIIAFGLLLLEYNRSKTKSIILLFSGIIGFLTIIWSGSRGGILSFAFGFLILLLIYTKKFNINIFKKIFILFILFVIMCVLLFYSYNISSYVNKNINKFSYEEISNNIRLRIWSNYIYDISSNPLGYGWGASKITSNRLAHNDVIEFTMQFGIFGFLLIIIIFIIHLKESLIQIKNLKIINQKFNYLIAVPIMIIFHSMVMGSYTSRIFWFYLALSTSAYQYNKYYSRI